MGRERRRGKRPRGCGGNGRGDAMLGSGIAGLRQERWDALDESRGCGRNAGTSAVGALDAGWTLWMRQNRAPRLAVNAYIRCLISSRDIKSI
jgi:hypothetical protein